MRRIYSGLWYFSHPSLLPLIQPRLPTNEHEEISMKKGKVYLIGAGPGDPELLTLKGKRCLEEADVIVGDYLADPRLLRYAKPG